MDSDIARWMQLKRFTREEIEKLHSFEFRFDAEWKSYMADVASGKRPYVFNGVRSWRERSLVIFDLLNKKIGPYWDKRKAEDERAFEVNKFISKSYPIWRPIFDQIGKGFTELETMHKADIAIWAGIDQINLFPSKTENRSKAMELIGE